MRETGDRLNIKMLSYPYRDPHVKDKTVSRPSYLQHGDSHTWKRRSLYLDGAQNSVANTMEFYHYCSSPSFRWSLCTCIMYLGFSFQSNSFPDRLTVYDFCFEKKASGTWIEWMDTVDKSKLSIPATAKVGGTSYTSMEWGAWISNYMHIK